MQTLGIKQVIRFGNRYLYPLGHLATSNMIFFLFLLKKYKRENLEWS